ncbi:helix-turn-helix domain-containing protein [Sphingomonas sp. RT2P30]|uniref:MerR family transcriptional regulator n=1 Tax=Parasphingomonas halimpatiens TaxID=3096162 RepID=UPI002FCB04E8
METLTIGRLARAAGTTPETVRWYEHDGLMAAPARSSGNYRVYGSDDLARLKFIRRARELGFTLDRVRALLDIASNRSGNCASVDAVTKDHLAEIDRKIADLKVLRGELASLVASCQGGTIDDCRIVEALGTRSN